MLQVTLWVGVAAAVCVAALQYGCGQTSFGTCSGNGTCPVPGADATAPLAEGGEGVGDGATVGLSDAGSEGSALAIGDSGDGATCNAAADPKDEPCLVSNAYGVFVSAGATGPGIGTKASPYNTLAAGIAAATAPNQRVFVCAGTYPEQLSVGASVDGVAVYGGFDCVNWNYASSNTVQVAPSQPGYALEVASLTVGATFEDMEFDAVDAQAPGASSVAVFANAAVATFRRVVMKAGNGAAGAAGDPGSNYPTDAGRAPSGNSADGSAGAPGLECTCSNGDQTIGGPGGAGVTPASDGTRGQPVLDGGQAGSGGNMTCTNGGLGAGTSDAPGAPGATAIGQLSSAGLLAEPGDSGVTASVAQGGGGGGGASGVSMAGGGASGGCGGCGGGGGGAGGAGGSSFALLSYQSTVTFDTCQISAGSAGAGGSGGPGQPGQAGGLSGAPSNPGCPGGIGGTGGGGGGGGGGAGGCSAAIGYTPPAPTQTSTVTTYGDAGAGGTGGTGGGASNSGGTGISGEAGAALEL